MTALIEVTVEHSRTDGTIYVAHVVGGDRWLLARTTRAEAMRAGVEYYRRTREEEAEPLTEKAKPR